MPLRIMCPHCRLTVVAHESQIGTAVSCPHCIKPFTVPAQYPLPQPVQQTPAFEEPPTEPVRRRARKSRGAPSWILFTSSAGLAAVIVGAVVGMTLLRNHREHVVQSRIQPGR